MQAEDGSLRLVSTQVSQVPPQGLLRWQAKGRVNLLAYWNLLKTKQKW
jgi:hypothetical protein